MKDDGWKEAQETARRRASCETDLVPGWSHGSGCDVDEFHSALPFLSWSQGEGRCLMFKQRASLPLMQWLHEASSPNSRQGCAPAYQNNATSRTAITSTKAAMIVPSTCWRLAWLGQRRASSLPNGLRKMKAATSRTMMICDKV